MHCNAHTSELWNNVMLMIIMMNILPSEVTSVSQYWELSQRLMASKCTPSNYDTGVVLWCALTCNKQCHCLRAMPSGCMRTGLACMISSNGLSDHDLTATRTTSLSLTNVWCQQRSYTKALQCQNTLKLAAWGYPGPATPTYT